MVASKRHRQRSLTHPLLQAQSEPDWPQLKAVVESAGALWVQQGESCTALVTADHEQAGNSKGKAKPAEPHVAASTVLVSPVDVGPPLKAPGDAQ